MSTAIALSTPRLRRFRRPPARVVLCFMEAANSFGACLYWLFTIALREQGFALGDWPTGVKAAFLALSAWQLISAWRELGRLIRQWLADRAIAPVRRR